MVEELYFEFYFKISMGLVLQMIKLIFAFRSVVLSLTHRPAASTSPWTCRTCLEFSFVFRGSPSVCVLGNPFCESDVPSKTGGHCLQSSAHNTHGRIGLPCRAGGRHYDTVTKAVTCNMGIPGEHRFKSWLSFLMQPSANMPVKTAGDRLKI